MTRSLRRLPMAALAALLVNLSACAPTSQQDRSEPADLPVGPIKGAYAPDLALTDLSGEEWTLADLRGKAVLLNFWTTW